jgi:hypothetical protein
MSFISTQQDIQNLQLSLALLLYDGFTRSQELTGRIAVSFANKPRICPFLPFQKTPQATFLFFGLLAGTYTVQVRSNDDPWDQLPPYYLPTDLSVTVADLSVLVQIPKPIWPAFPDINLADGNKPLDDPTQTEAYRVQRSAATLQPAAAYPFPVGATLVRGHVLANGKPLADAKVQMVGSGLQYPTSEDGEFVLFFTQISGVGETVNLQATHALHPTVKQAIDIHRGMTVATNIVMAP